MVVMAPSDDDVLRHFGLRGILRLHFRARMGRWLKQFRLAARSRRGGLIDGERRIGLWHVHRCQRGSRAQKTCSFLLHDILPSASVLCGEQIYAPPFVHR